jgi:hypothetical protein
MSQSVFERAEGDLVPDGRHEDSLYAGLKVALRIAHVAHGDDYPVTAGENYWTTARTVLLPYLGTSVALRDYSQAISSLEYKASKKV